MVASSGSMRAFPDAVGDEVDDLEVNVSRLREHEAGFRNDIVTGVGGKQILLEDPSGNPVELFEPTIPQARLPSAS